MTRLILTLGIASLVIIGASCSQKRMTPAKFQEIVTTPGDGIPLAGEMKVFPYWTNFEADIDLKYEDGRSRTDHVIVTAKTVQGRYVVFTMNSPAYKQPINSVVGYDPESATYKTWGELDQLGGPDSLITESSTTLNPQAKTYAQSVTYYDYTEVGKGSYTDTEDRSHTLIYKNGNLVFSRDVLARPIRK